MGCRNEKRVVFIAVNSLEFGFDKSEYKVSLFFLLLFLLHVFQFSLVRMSRRLVLILNAAYAPLFVSFTPSSLFRALKCLDIDVAPSSSFSLSKKHAEQR